MAIVKTGKDDGKILEVSSDLKKLGRYKNDDEEKKRSENREDPNKSV